MRNKEKQNLMLIEQEKLNLFNYTDIDIFMEEEEENFYSRIFGNEGEHWDYSDWLSINLSN